LGKKNESNFGKKKINENKKIKREVGKKKRKSAKKREKKKREEWTVDYYCNLQCIWVSGNSDFPTPFSFMLNLLF
jgi:hypothetical protein